MKRINTYCNCLWVIFSIWPLLFYGQARPAAKTATSTPGKALSKPDGASFTGGCSLYFPLKPGSTFRYLKTSRTQKKEYIRAFEVFHNYYNAKDRVIFGQKAKGYIREEIIKRLDDVNAQRNPDLGDLFTSGTLRREDRLYYACGSIDDGKGATVSYLAEAKEITKQTSTVVGSYTEVTETYKGRSIVPSDISYREIPEVEYNKIGTGRFNVRIISTTNTADAFRHAGYTIDFQLENRMAMGALGEMYSYENSYFQIVEQLSSKKVLGKEYKDVLHFKELIYEAKEKGSKEDGKLIATNEYYYAKGIGLIMMTSIEMYRVNTGSDQQMLQNLFSSNDKSDILTVFELLPEGADARKMIDQGELSRSAVTAKQENGIFTSSNNRPGVVTQNQFQTLLDSLTGKASEELVGLWVAPYPNRVMEKVSYTFKPDGTYEYSDYGSLFTVPEKGHWRLNGKEIQLLTDISTLQERKYSSVSIKRYNIDVAQHEKAGKPSIKLEREYFKVKTEDIPQLLKTMKPEWMIKSENQSLEGLIDSDIVGRWRVEYPRLFSYREYIFNADGTGTYVDENKKNKTRETQKFNWRLKGTTLFQQILCEQPPCPRGEKYIIRTGCEKVTENGKAALAMGDRSKYIKQ